MRRFQPQLRDIYACSYSGTRKNYQMPPPPAKQRHEVPQKTGSIGSPQPVVISKLESGARLPTAVSCLWDQRTPNVKHRNEWQVANVNYDKSMSTLEQSARKLYKSAKLRPVVSEQGRGAASRAANCANCPNCAGDKAVKPSSFVQRLAKLFLVPETEPKTFVSAFHAEHARRQFLRDLSKKREEQGDGDK